MGSNLRAQRTPATCLPQCAGGGSVGIDGFDEREPAADFDAIGLATETSSRANYYPGAQPMRIKIVADRRTGRLLGAQIVRGEGAGKRIDVLAAALWNDTAVRR